jgi:hypothetical protein
MTSGLYSKRFSKVFSRLLEENRVSCYKISLYSHLDEAYVNRLKSGEKSNPSPETIEKISLALVHCSKNVSLDDVEELFHSVGYSLRTRPSQL